MQASSIFDQSFSIVNNVIQSGQLDAMEFKKVARQTVEMYIQLICHLYLLESPMQQLHLVQ